MRLSKRDTNYYPPTTPTIPTTTKVPKAPKAPKLPKLLHGLGGCQKWLLLNLDMNIASNRPDVGV